MPERLSRFDQAGRSVGNPVYSVLDGALDDARARGLRVLPLCPFVKDWISTHEDYHDLLYGSPPSSVTARAPCRTVLVVPRVALLRIGPSGLRGVLQRS